MPDQKFATVINCMDGRVQEPVSRWIKQHYAVDFVDDITEPGADCVVCQADKKALKELEAKVRISTEKHGSHVLVLSGHYDCAANPGPKEDHVAEIKQSLKIIKSWGLGVDLVGLWVNAKWHVERVA